MDKTLTKSEPESSGCDEDDETDEESVDLSVKGDDCEFMHISSYQFLLICVVML